MAVTCEIPLYQVDAFTAAPFGGNPAAVCLLGPSHLPLSNTLRAKIAGEMNLSETAFVEDLGGQGFQASSRFKIRWFTASGVEVALCGHATLASAAALIQGEGNKQPVIYFETNNSGVLTVAAAGRSEQYPVLEMGLPLIAPGAADFSAESDVVQAVACGLPVAEVLFAGQNGMDYLLVVLQDSVSRAQLEAVQPDFRHMSDVQAETAVKGTILSAAGGGAGHDILSRFFAPKMGIDEDPVTGSAHAVLGPYWAGRLGKTELSARQCSSRGSEVIIVVDEAQAQVTLRATATIVSRGTLYLPTSSL